MRRLGMLLLVAALAVMAPSIVFAEETQPTVALDACGQGFPLMSWTSSNSKEAAVRGTAACAAVPAVDGCGVATERSARRADAGLTIPTPQK